MTRQHRAAPRLTSVIAIATALSAAAAWQSVRPLPVFASDPMGVYSLVEDVQYEPDKLEPERIRIYGIHALSERIKEGPRANQGIYSEPKVGYLYFRCASGQTDVCRMEWADLEKAIGDSRCAAYGDRYLTDPKPNGRLRDIDEPPADPDTYPKGQGVTMTEHGWQQTCDEIRELAATLGTPAAVPTAVPPAETPADPTAALPIETLPPPADASGSYLPKIDGKTSAGAAAAAGAGSVAGDESAAGQDQAATKDGVGSAGATSDDGGGGAPSRSVPSWLILAVMAGIGAGVVGAGVVLSRGHRG